MNHAHRSAEPGDMTCVDLVDLEVDPRGGTLRGGADIRRERYAFGW